MIGISSRGIKKISSFDVFLDEEAQFINDKKSFSRIAGWGHKTNTKKSRAYAEKHNLPYISLEDGFIRSLGLGVSGSPLLSLVIDDLGIYYNARTPSHLEQLILDGGVDPDVHKAISLIKKHRISKYNQAPHRELPFKFGPRVLVIDQTLNDVSVSLGGADGIDFNNMLKVALQENPYAEIIVKTHPDVLAGKKKGYLTQVPSDPRIKLYSDDISPLSLLEQVDKVYVVTSQMGFEALLLGKPVNCFGLPWYAAWGLTDDRHKDIEKLKKRRNVKRSVDERFLQQLILNIPRYLNTCNKEYVEIYLTSFHTLPKTSKAMNELRGDFYCQGMTLWKRDVATPFLDSPVTSLRFRKFGFLIPKNVQVISWGIKYPNKNHWRMEDGFLRSVGLGSDLIRPISLVLDKHGIYYDPFSGSDLERILQNQILDEFDLERARSFREKYVAMKMSKYNLGKSGFEINPGDKKVILVPGQVEDDASIRRGSPIINTNQGLLNTVRKNNPEAYIIYKPHPDVVVGNRKGALTDPSVADAVVVDANIIDCIEVCHELHTMTSLSGFEALLHGKVVHCYGGPFYAGWGLTVDHMESSSSDAQSDPR